MRFRPTLVRLRERLRPAVLHGVVDVPAPACPRPDGWLDQLEVIVPAYNHAPYLPAALRSVEEQSWDRPFSLCVVDDRSTDDTLEIARAFADRMSADGGRIRVRLPQNEVNSRQWKSINNAVETSQASWFVVLNDDDVLAPYAIEALAAIFERHPDVALAGGSSLWFSGEPPGFPDPPRRPVPRLFRPAHAARFRRLNDLNMTHTSTAFTRSAWEAVGGYRPPERRIHATANEDRDFQMRVCARYPVAVLVDLPLAGWRHDSTHGKSF